MAEGDRDPGDAVPPGVAPAEPVPLNDHDRAVKRQLERLPAERGEPVAEPSRPEG